MEFHDALAVDEPEAPGEEAEDVGAANLAAPAAPALQFGPNWHDRFADIDSMPVVKSVGDVLAEMGVNTQAVRSADVDGLVVEVPVKALVSLCPHWSYTVLSDRKPPQGELQHYNCVVATAPYNVWIPTTSREAALRQLQVLPERAAARLHSNNNWWLFAPLTLDGTMLSAILEGAGVSQVVVQGAYGTKSSLPSVARFLASAASALNPDHAPGGAKYLRAYIDVAQQFPPLFVNEYSFFSVAPIDADGQLVETPLERDEDGYRSLSHVLPTSAGPSIKLTRYPVAMLLTDRCHGGVQLEFPPNLAPERTCVIKTKVYSRLRQVHTALFGGSGVPGTGPRPKKLTTVLSRLSQTDLILQWMQNPDNWASLCGYRVENTVRVRVPILAPEAASSGYSDWITTFVETQAKQCTLQSVIDSCACHVGDSSVAQQLGFTVVQVGASALARHAGVIHAALHAELSRVSTGTAAKPRMHIMFLHWMSLSAVGIFSLTSYLYATAGLRGKYSDWMATESRSLKSTFTWMVETLNQLCMGRRRADIPYLPAGGEVWAGAVLDKVRATIPDRDAAARTRAPPVPPVPPQPVAQLFAFPVHDERLREQVAQAATRDALSSNNLFQVMAWIQVKSETSGFDCNTLAEVFPRVFAAMTSGLDWKLTNSGRRQWQLRSAVAGTLIVRSNSTIVEGIVKLLTQCPATRDGVAALIASLPFLPADTDRENDYIRAQDWQEIHNLVQGAKWEQYVEAAAPQGACAGKRVRWGVTVNNQGFQKECVKFLSDKRSWPLTKLETAAAVYNAAWAKDMHWGEVVVLREGLTQAAVVPAKTLGDRRVTRNAVLLAEHETAKVRARQRPQPVAPLGEPPVPDGAPVEPAHHPEPLQPVTPARGAPVALADVAPPGGTPGVRLQDNSTPEAGTPKARDAHTEAADAIEGNQEAAPNHGTSGVDDDLASYGITLARVGARRFKCVPHPLT